ncbi:hypothetical protein BH09BAC3_BH09BAC3_36670 [soil metagenome]
MKSVLIFIVTLFISIAGMGQNSMDPDFATKLRKIIASAATNFSSLKSSQAIGTPSGTRFQSKLNIKDTESSTIAIATNKDENDHYIISIMSSMNKAESQRLNSFWDTELKSTLGPTVVRDCHVVDVDDSISADQCDFQIFKKDYSVIVSLIQRPLSGSDLFMLEIRVAKKSI